LWPGTFLLAPRFTWLSTARIVFDYNIGSSTGMGMFSWLIDGTIQFVKKSGNDP